MWVRTTGRPAPQWGDLRIDPDTHGRYRAFAARIGQRGVGEPAARRALASAFGDTYFFYYVFGSTAGRSFGQAR